MFAQFRQAKFYIRNTSSWIGRVKGEVGNKTERTHTNNGRIIRHSGRLAFFGSRALFDPQILDIGATEDDIIIDLVGGWNLVLGVGLSALGTV